ncbi:hypothetical protein OJJOAM_002668 [Cupriavidus sp. H18C1]
MASCVNAQRPEVRRRYAGPTPARAPPRYRKRQETAPCRHAGPPPAPDARVEGVFSRIDAMTLEDCPIEPDWVRAGRPQARAATHAMARDGLASTHLWECSAGAFAWRFSVEETVLILDGEVRVTSPGGQVRTLRAGDVGHFPRPHDMAVGGRPPCAQDRLLPARGAVAAEAVHAGAGSGARTGAGAAAGPRRATARRPRRRRVVGALRAAPGSAVRKSEHAHTTPARKSERGHSRGKLFPFVSITCSRLSAFASWHASCELGPPIYSVAAPGCATTMEETTWLPPPRPPGPHGAPDRVPNGCPEAGPRRRTGAPASVDLCGAVRRLARLSFPKLSGPRRTPQV